MALMSLLTLFASSARKYVFCYIFNHLFYFVKIARLMTLDFIENIFLENTVVVSDYLITMKTTFDFNFYLNQAVKEH